MSKHFHLMIPGLLPDVQFTFGKSFPNLSLLLAKSKANLQSKLSLDVKISELFGLGESDFPAGALCALYYNIIERDQTEQFFCQVDPIETRLDAQTAFLSKTLYADLCSDDVSKLKKILSTLFEPKYHLRCQSDSWFCTLPHKPDLLANPIWDALGKSLHCRLPSGPDAATYQRLLTECEMLLSTQDMDVSSLWFWGFGALPKEVKTDFDLLISNEVSLRGLAKCASIECADLLENPNLESPARNVLLVDTTLLQLQRQGQVEQWIAAIQGYEKGWMAILLEGLSSAKVASITLDFGQDTYYKITKNNLNYFWRRRKALEDFI